MVPDGAPFRLSGQDPGARPFFADKKAALRSIRDDAKAIDALQDRLYAEGARALLVVLQGVDTSGKSGTIRKVFADTGPIGVRVTSFGKPSEEELAHDYLWRVHRATPPLGYIGVFDRSHYEDVLVVRVDGLAPRERIDERYEQINAFERHLTDNGVVILKFFLHISYEVQAERLRARLEDANKHWKFNPHDYDAREMWDQYMSAYDLALERCSTEHAPWWVIPSNSKSRRNALVARIVRGTLEDMDPKPRDPGWREKDMPIPP